MLDGIKHVAENYRGGVCSWPGRFPIPVLRETSPCPRQNGKPSSS